MDTFAHLLTELMAALGFPDKSLLELEDAARALRSALAFYDLELGQSNQRLVLAKSPFTPSAREAEFAGVKGVPLWIEYQLSPEPADVWRYVPAVNLAAVEDAAERGEERCAFYSENGRLKVRLSYLPDGATPHRLRYDPDPQAAATLADPLSVPAKFYPMYRAQAVLEALPMMMGAAAKLPEGARPSELQLEAWKAMGASAERVLAQYAPLWKQHRLASRGGARGRDRRPVIPGVI